MEASTIYLHCNLSILSHIKPKANDLVLALQTLVIFVMLVMLLKFTARACQVSNLFDYAMKRTCCVSLCSAVVHLFTISSRLN